MRIGLAYDLKAAVETHPNAPEDAREEYDPPGTIDALTAEIRRLGHHVVPLGGGPEFLQKVRELQVDFVFNIAEGRGVYRSREAQVPAVLEMLGIPYSGSDPLTLALCLDKAVAKRVLLAAGIATPRFAVVQRPEDLSHRNGGWPPCPVVVKPVAEGSSKGIRSTSRAATWDEVCQCIPRLLRDYRQPALVEEFIPGKEVTVGIVGNGPPRVVGVMEVVPRNGAGSDFMYTLEVKRDWKRQVAYRCPAELPPEALRAVEETALRAFTLLQCRDLARLDFRVDQEDRPYLLEVNPLPGLGDYSDLVIMGQLVGLSFSQLVEEVLGAALARCGLGS